MNKVYICDINKKLREEKSQFILKCESDYYSQIKNMADNIIKVRETKPIILLSGPSGAGKTTTALKIEEYLDAMDVSTHTISMDDYFLPMDQTPQAVTETGEVDYESPYRLDIPLLNEHMMRIANCEEVLIPSFNFATQQRTKGEPLKIKKGDLVILEGIHALNPDVTGLTQEFANCVYVSVRSRIQTVSGACLHPCLIRLMRRIIRDKFFRARKPIDTIAMFNSVERGENLYIMPYKKRAEFCIDTFIPYEVSVYKRFLYDDLIEISKTYDDFERFKLISTALDELDEVALELVPENSLVREFTGQSSYEY